MLQKLQTWPRLYESCKNPNNNSGKIGLSHTREGGGLKGPKKERRDEDTKEDRRKARLSNREDSERERKRGTRRETKGLHGRIKSSRREEEKKKTEMFDRREKCEGGEKEGE